MPPHFVYRSFMDSASAKRTPHGQDRRKVTFFVSYAHKNTEDAFRFLELLKAQCAPSRKYSFEFLVDRRELREGRVWDEQLEGMMARSEFGLLLLSPSFFDSQYIKDFELPHFWDRTENKVRKLSFPVELDTIDIDRQETLGMHVIQWFRGKDKQAQPTWSFTRSVSNGTREFPHECFQKLEAWLDAELAAGAIKEFTARDQSSRVRAARRLDATVRRLNPSPLVGREAEKLGLERLLSEKSGRLITIFGSGGVGKTHLAAETVQNILDQDASPFRPVAFVQLTEFTGSSADDLLGFVLPEVTATDHEIEDRWSALSAALTIDRKTTLLVLDNCETCMSSVKSFIQSVLERCPAVKILATSQGRIGLLQFERVLNVLPLDTPKAASSKDELQKLPCFHLLKEKVLACSGKELPVSDYPTIAEILRWTGGRPFAIQIVAPRIAEGSLEKLLHELNSEPLGGYSDLKTMDIQVGEDRHGSIASCIAWSFRYNLDEEALRHVLIASMFRGSFSKDDICEIAGASQDDHVTRSLRKMLPSLVTPVADTQPPKFALDLFARKYAHAWAKEKNEWEALVEAHLKFLLKKLEQTKTRGRAVDLESTDEPAPRPVSLSVEYLLECAAGVRYADELEKPDVVWSITESIFNALDHHGYWGELEDIVRRCLKFARQDSLERKDIVDAWLLKLGMVLRRTGRQQEAYAALHEALLSSRERAGGADQPRVNQVLALKMLMPLCTALGRSDEANDYSLELSQCARTLRYPIDMARSLDELGKQYLNRSLFERALECFQEALELRKNVQNTLGEGLSHANIGTALLKQGLASEACAEFELAAECFTEDTKATGRPNEKEIAGLYAEHGEAESRRGNFVEAETLLRKSLSMRAEVSKGLSVTFGKLGAVLAKGGRLNEALEAYGQSKEISMQLGDVAGASRALDEMGEIWYFLKDIAKAETAYNESIKLRSQNGYTDRRGLGITWDRLGRLYTFTRDFVKAEEAHRQAVALLAEAKDTYPMVLALRNLALILNRRNAPEAEMRLDAAIQLCEKSENWLLLSKLNAIKGRLKPGSMEDDQHLTQRLADAELDANCADLRKSLNPLLRKKDWKAAIKLCEELIEQFQQPSDKQFLAVVLMELGSAHRNAGNFVAARQALNSALDLFETLGSEAGKARVWHKFGDLCSAEFKSGDESKSASAMDFYAKSIDANKGNDIGRVITITALSQLHHRCGNTKEGIDLMVAAWPIMEAKGTGEQKKRHLEELMTLFEAMPGHPSRAQWAAIAERHGVKLGRV